MKNITIVLLIAVAVITSMCTESESGYMDKSDINITDIPGMSGKGGSMARFSISNNALYVLREVDVQAYDISNPKAPDLKTTTSLNWGMETIFTYDTLLFFGSQTGMSVYSIKNPYAIEYVTMYEHFTSCDPVVFDGKYAYVTLNSANINCGRGLNELQVVDMTDIYSPYNLNSYSMTSPKGLGVDGNFLFVCDDNKLKVYNKSNPIELVPITEFELNQAYDVIPYNGNLIVTSSGGISQFSYSIENSTIDLISTILVEQD